MLLMQHHAERGEPGGGVFEHRDTSRGGPPRRQSLIIVT
jgi:hypothetical protein